ncbi:response regulator receiver sensor signal transduction histidine kinase [Cyanobacterium stanieri PCC 7202]|uniref:histidine kinase n=1 Tax=Cyanobacterium stanieri (strain ATCC 29140 / PCC 7202) TaxID=292563 RepID=K9YI23_CYASC|nr:response regulator receiver sensor signal transduction histidine kinase [Cyanobacterium stanieri PCC 7202]
MTKILVIDDNNDLRDSVREILTTLGFEIITAVNGKEGLELIKQNTPDLILCDVAMPTMSGYELLETLQKEDEIDYIPFIFLTGNSDRRDMRRGMELGADDYLFKPFTIDSLVKAINTRLEKTARLKKQSVEKLAELRQNISFALPHEINTPLNGINSSAQLLKDYHDSLTREELREIADLILDSTQRLTHLMQNFLLYAELELISKDDHKIEQIRNSDRSKCNIKNILSSIAQTISSNYNRQSDLFLDVENVFVKIAENNLEKICHEIIDNAFKYSQFENPVTITSQRQKNNFLKVSIHNKGKGMTKEEIERVGAYMQFQRRKYEQQGSGLGFAIAQKMLEIYGGSISINSIYDQETQVDLILPMV